MKITKEEDNQIKILSKAIALAVRDNIEDFHVKHLTDTQMKELNPLIRDAVYSFLKAHRKGVTWLALHYQRIPSYWEEPVDIYKKRVY